MILDKDTNRLYFSEKLREYNDFTKIESILNEHKINYDFLKGTKDIWCRDYMPVQKSQDEFIQFRYQPSYLSDDINLRTNPKDVLKHLDINVTFSDINLDGGNVIKWDDKVILTERIYRENDAVGKSDKNRLVQELENLFEADIFLIPDLAPDYDMTGHADGHVRFIDKSTLLVNELNGEDYHWVKGFEKMIKKSGLDYEEIPCDSKDDDDLSAVGIYVNYLEIDKLIIFPIFEENETDAEALAVMKTLFKDREIVPIQINDIAREGGLMNCISWTIKA